jgi:peptide/nickel transport system substrate-binding protein
MIIPKHRFEPYRGAKSREAPTNLKPVGTGPYRFVDFKPGDIVRGELNPSYHVPNRPFFDQFEMKGGGDAASAARAVLQTGEYDFAWNLQVADEILKRMEQGGKGRVDMATGGSVESIKLNNTDPWKDVDGERSSLKTTHPFLTDPAVRGALNLLVDRGAVHEEIYGRLGQATANYLNAPSRFRSRNTRWEFSVDKANQMLEAAGWKRGADGIRAKDGKRLKMVFQTSANPERQKTQAIVKQACEGGRRDRAEAGGVLGLLLVRRGQPGHRVEVLRRPPDVHERAGRARSPDLHGAVHVVGGLLEGQQVAGPQQYALA